MNGISSLSACYLRSFPNIENDTNQVLNQISFSTSVEHYHRLTQVFQKHKPHLASSFGWNALCLASYCGNVDLVRYIVNNNQNVRLIDLGTSFGWTPLLCASLSVQHQAAYEIGEYLIHKGAEINARTPSEYRALDFRTYRLMVVPKDVTPVWCCSIISKNQKLFQLLREKGGIIHPPIWISPILMHA